MCQVKSSENLEGISSGGLLNRGKKNLDSLYKLGRQSLKFERKCSYKGP